MALATTTALVLFAGSLQVIVAKSYAASPVLPQMDDPAPALSHTPESPSQKHLVETIKQPVLQRPTEAYRVAEPPGQPDAWFSPEVLAMAPTVDPLEYTMTPAAKVPISNDDLRLYPEPKDYAQFVDSDRLIAPAGASYQTSLTMGTFIGTSFGANDFFIGTLSGPDLPPGESGITSAGYPITRRVRKPDK